MSEQLVATVNASSKNSVTATFNTTRIKQHTSVTIIK